MYSAVKAPRCLCGSTHIGCTRHQLGSNASRNAAMLQCYLCTQPILTPNDEHPGRTFVRLCAVVRSVRWRTDRERVPVQKSELKSSFEVR